MAIYRPARRRWPAMLSAAILGFLIGLAIGLVVVSSGEPDVEEALGSLRESSRAAAGLLEVAEVEYQEALSGTEVTSDPEYQAARDALQQSMRRYARVISALDGLAPGVAASVERAYDEVEELMSARASEQQVTEALEELGLLVSGGSSPD